MVEHDDGDEFGGADSNRVELGPEFLARLQRTVVRFTLARGRDELGPGRAEAGAGDEFVGHRPYRAGEEPRDVDWSLFARLERPFVRVRRRDVGEHWVILLDTSASMGLGAPGKLQFAAELATALAHAGLGSGARTTLLALGQAQRIEAVHLRRPADLRGWIEFLVARRAEGAGSLRSSLVDARIAGARRLIAIGDLFDVEPADLLALARRGRRVDAIRVLAPHELTPRESPGVAWLDPESHQRWSTALDARTLRAYGEALERRLDLWRASFARHGQRCHTFSSAVAFEDAARRVLG